MSVPYVDALLPAARFRCCASAHHVRRMSQPTTSGAFANLRPAPTLRPSVFVLLVSKGAGGVGLNLTAANRVVVLDTR